MNGYGVSDTTSKDTLPHWHEPASLIGRGDFGGRLTRRLRAPYACAMSDRSYHTTAAFRELLDLVRDSDQLFLTGPRAVGDEVTVVEGYRWLTEVLSVALECYLW